MDARPILDAGQIPDAGQNLDAGTILDAADTLLAIQSTADRPAELARALDFVIAFAGPGFTVERFESQGKPSALLYRSASRPAEFAVILNAHLDVVPAPPEMFRPRREGQRLYARGAQDMKISALAMTQAFTAHHKDHEDHKAREDHEARKAREGEIALQLVTDEETGGQHGTCYQLANHGVRTRFAIIGESSGLRVVNESRGIAAVTLDARGRSAHSAYQWLGDNALVKLTRSIEAILTRYPVAEQEQWRTTVNLARIQTPNLARNQVPDQAQAWLDIRYPAEDPDFAKQPEDIARHLQEFCQPGVTVTVDRMDAPHRTNPDIEQVNRLRAAARGQGYPGDLLRKHGSGDGRFYGQRSIPAVAFGIGGGGQHGPDEYADLTTIAPYREALRQFLSEQLLSQRESTASQPE